MKQSEETALHAAAQNGRLEVVSLLLDRGADIEAKNEVCVYHIYTPFLQSRLLFVF
jgi:ankyrin repeat protein